jgi:agmatine deiminase
MTRMLARSEPVRILVRNAAAYERAQGLLARARVSRRRVAFHVIPTNRSWIRDYGPLFVKQGRRVVITDWKFNGWARYSNWRLDNAVNARLAQILGMPRVTPRARGRAVVLEGGSLDVNGRGTLLTTEACHLSRVQARNPGLGRAGMEALFREVLGARNVIWLGRGVRGDDTHGHVDDLARFTDPRTVATVVERNPRDPNHAPLAENLRRLRRARDQDGRPLRIATLPMPRAIFDGRDRLPASYSNFYIANRHVLVPTFNDPNDRVALKTLAGLFPGREVVGIHAVDIILGQGAIHCLTQQQPR